MGNFGIGEMAVIAIFALLVFGPQRLPEIARSVGGFIREFKSVTSGITKEFQAEMDAAPRPKPVAKPDQIAVAVPVEQNFSETSVDKAPAENGPTR